MTEHEKAEQVRLKYKYRKLIMQGKIELPITEAARLIGPDCAYHLYSQITPIKSDESQNCDS